MNLINLSFLIGVVVFVWVLTFLGFANAGLIARDVPVLPQSGMYVATVAVTAMVCLGLHLLFNATGPKSPREPNSH